jgi:type VI secretion system protein ImpA
MSTSDSLLDFDQLLEPITPENPCGESLRWDPIWDELKQLRKSGKDLVDSSGDKEADWGKLSSLSTSLLLSRTKDLQIAGWLTEALVHTSGFAGLRDGLKLVNGLVEKFWDGLHPLPEEQDWTNRASPLVWLAQKDGGAKLPAIIREVSLTSLSQSDEPVLNWNFWHRRLASPRGKDEKEDVYKARMTAAEQSKKTFDAAVDAAPISVYQTLLADIDACLETLVKLGESLSPRLTGDLSLDWGKLRTAIGEIRVFVYDVLKRRGGLPKVAEATSEATQEDQVMNANVNGAELRTGPIRSRADAMAQLEEAAKFFSETEPHSPVAYLVRRAVRWAAMPFEEVLGELVKDDKLVKQISETLGIVSTPPK